MQGRYLLCWRINSSTRRSKSCLHLVLDRNSNIEEIQEDSLRLPDVGHAPWESPGCKKGKDDVHPNAPQRAQKRRTKDTRMNAKSKGGICKFYSETKWFSHDGSSSEREASYKKVKLSNKQKKETKIEKAQLWQA